MLRGGSIPKRRVETTIVVVGFYVAEKGTLHFVHITRDPVLEELGFDRAYCRLCDGVVPAVALPAHAGSHPELPKPILVVAGGVSAVSVRVVEKPSSWALRGHGVLKCLKREVRVAFRGNSPTHDRARAQVYEDRDVCPALQSPNVRRVADPCLVGLFPRKPSSK